MPEGDRIKSFDIAAFSLEGLRIARAIKWELPDWTVIYYDEAKAEATRDNEYEPRSTFEYEIHL